MNTFALRNNDLMPEWSKGVHLRCTVFVLVGSNPTQVNGSLELIIDNVAVIDSVIVIRM